MNERWMAVAGWPGYEVSDMGRMRSIDRVIVRRDGTVQTNCLRGVEVPTGVYR